MGFQAQLEAVLHLVLMNDSSFEVFLYIYASVWEEFIYVLIYKFIEMSDG